MRYPLSATTGAYHWVIGAEKDGHNLDSVANR